jgi:hypothetical protein
VTVVWALACISVSVIVDVVMTDAIEVGVGAVNVDVLGAVFVIVLVLMTLT